MELQQHYQHNPFPFFNQQQQCQQQSSSCLSTSNCCSSSQQDPLFLFDNSSYYAPQYNHHQSYSSGFPNHSFFQQQQQQLFCDLNGFQSIDFPSASSTSTSTSCSTSCSSSSSSSNTTTTSTCCSFQNNDIDRKPNPILLQNFLDVQLLEYAQQLQQVLPVSSSSITTTTTPTSSSTSTPLPIKPEVELLSIFLQSHNESDSSRQDSPLSDSHSSSTSEEWSKPTAMRHKQKSRLTTIANSKTKKTTKPKTKNVSPTSKVIVSCDECQEYFKNNSNVVWYRNIHDLVPEDLVNCEICGGGFKRRLEIRQRGFDCKLCHVTFDRADRLLAHSRLHTGVKAYACLHCHRSFSRKDRFTAHVKSRHPNAAIAIKPSHLAEE